MARLKTSQHYGVKSNCRGYRKPKHDPYEITWDDLYSYLPPPGSQSSGGIKPMKQEPDNGRSST